MTKITNTNLDRIMKSLDEMPLDLTDPLDQAMYMVFDSNFTGREITSLCNNHVTFVAVNNARARTRDEFIKKTRDATIDIIAKGYQDLVAKINKIGAISAK